MININCEDKKNGWILRRASEELRDNIDGITINGKPAEINYSINYALYKDTHGRSKYNQSNSAQSRTTEN